MTNEEVEEEVDRELLREMVALSLPMLSFFLHSIDIDNVAVAVHDVDIGILRDVVGEGVYLVVGVDALHDDRFHLPDEWVHAGCEDAAVDEDFEVRASRP